jgi:hypothetical protein
MTKKARKLKRQYNCRDTRDIVDHLKLKILKN